MISEANTDRIRVVGLETAAVARTLLKRGYNGAVDVELASQAAQSYLGFIVVDTNCRVRLCFWDDQTGEAARKRFCVGDTSLRPDIEALVFAAIADACRRDSGASHLVCLDQQKALWFSPLAGGNEALFALIVETDRNHYMIARATAKFHLTRRQTDVLGLLLEGANTGEIAGALSISEYTAQGYIKSLLTKTSARNRAAMVAKVLEWKQVSDGGVDATSRGTRSHDR